MQKKRTIRLHGCLGAKFGRVYELAVNSPAEAIRALCAIVPGFERFLMQSKGEGLAYAVFIGSDNISADHLKAPVGNRDIRIAPILAGSKRAGLFQTIVGVALIAISYFTGGSTLATGIALVAGGVIQMLSPVPKGLGSQDSPDNKPSYSFNGPVNTSAQGNPVPLLYGRMIVGSAVISAGIFAEDQM